MPAPYLLNLPASVSDLDCRPDGGRREAGRRPTHRSYCSIALKHRFQAHSVGIEGSLGPSKMARRNGRLPFIFDFSSHGCGRFKHPI